MSTAGTSEAPSGSGRRRRGQRRHRGRGYAGSRGGARRRRVVGNGCDPAAAARSSYPRGGGGRGGRLLGGDNGVAALVERGESLSSSLTHPKRRLGSSAFPADVRRAVFHHKCLFKRGEVVLVPRSRGGFSYAKVVKHNVVHRCFINPNVKGVRYHAWRVLYQNALGERLYKQLPSVFLGKLSSDHRGVRGKAATHNECKDETLNGVVEKKASETAKDDVEEEEEDTAYDEEEDDDDLDGETILFSGFLSARADHADHDDDGGDAVVKDDGEENVEEDDEEDDNCGILGSPASDKDLGNVYFSPSNTFKCGELVLVPRTAGGLSYGRVTGTMRCPCPLGDHSHSGWRVLLRSTRRTGKGVARVVKKLFACNMGKLHHAEVAAFPAEHMENEAPVAQHQRHGRRHQPRRPHRHHRSGADGGNKHRRGIIDDVQHHHDDGDDGDDDDGGDMVLVPSSPSYVFVEPDGGGGGEAHEDDHADVGAQPQCRTGAFAQRGLFDAMAPLRAPARRSAPSDAGGVALARGGGGGRASSGTLRDVRPSGPPPLSVPEPIFDGGDAPSSSPAWTSVLTETPFPLVTSVAGKSTPPGRRVVVGGAAEAEKEEEEEEEASMFFVEDITRGYVGRSNSLDLSSDGDANALAYSSDGANALLSSSSDDPLVNDPLPPLELRLHQHAPSPPSSSSSSSLLMRAPIYGDGVPSSVEDRNRALVRTMKSLLGEDGFVRFRQVSSDFREGSVSPVEYYAHLCGVFGGDLEAIFDDLVDLLPDLRLRERLREEKRAAHAPMASSPGHHSRPRLTRECTGKPLIVLDAPNIARRHGGATISARGIEIAVRYYTDRGHPVTAFMPEHYVRRKPMSSKSASVLIGGKASRSALSRQAKYAMVDDHRVIRRLMDDGFLALTPPQDYDDSYCIEYAKQHDGFIVTNDQYWDHIEKMSGKKRERTHRWIRTHCISFMFVKDEFLPNPDFEFPTRGGGVTRR